VVYACDTCDEIKFKIENKIENIFLCVFNLCGVWFVLRVVDVLSLVAHFSRTEFNLKRAAF